MLPFLDRHGEMNIMKIQVNTDHNVEGSDALVRMVEEQIQSTLGRYEDRLSRVEAHLGDEDGSKNRGADKRCLLEARPLGRDPVVVTAFSDTSERACREASHKMQKLLASTFGRIDGGHDADATIRQNDPEYL